jgi:ornithine cyclodeaminase
MILVLSKTDIERLLPMGECIDVMADALASLARGELMPAHRAVAPAAFGLKAINIVPANPARGLDAHQGAVLLSDGETGELIAVLNASTITAIRTAAVSAVATRALAREDARELAILGAGVQARSHLQAMAAVRSFERARIWSRTRANAERLAAEADAPFPVEVAESPEAAVTGADVIVTATSTPTPVVERAWLADGAHVNAVGSSIPTTRELDGETVAAASLFVDRRESTENESGDYLIALREGAIAPGHIRAELGEVLVGAAPGRTSDAELTLFKSLGIAVEDLAAAQHVVARARETGAGTEVAF